jgi:hypothetical protein
MAAPFHPRDHGNLLRILRLYVKETDKLSPWKNYFDTKHGARSLVKN